MTLTIGVLQYLDFIVTSFTILTIYREKMVSPGLNFLNSNILQWIELHS